MIAFDTTKRASRGVRALGLMLLVAATFFAMVARPAYAEFGFVPGSFASTASTLQAGAHADITTAFTLNSHIGAFGPEDREPDDNVKDVLVALPPGLIGNPQAYPQCSGAFYVNHQYCPIDTQVGIVTLGLNYVGTPITEGSPVYNMVPVNGHVAELMFPAFGAQVHIAVSVRTGGDYGITAKVSNISSFVPVLSSSLTLWGVPSDPSHDAQRGIPAAAGHGEPVASGMPPVPFMSNPTQCGVPAPTTITADAWQSQGEFLPSLGSAANELRGCEKLSFNPAISVQPESRQAGAPSGYTVDLKVPQSENPYGLRTPDLRKAVVMLPRGVAVSPSAADGLQGCSDAQIAIGSSQPATCPAASKIGEVTVHTPLLSGPLTGAVYQGTQTPSQLLRLFIVASGDGVTVKLAGNVNLDPVTGQITAVFDNNPQQPFSDFVLKFNGGSRAPLVNPTTCGTYTTTSDLTPWSTPSTADATPSSLFTIDEGCATGAFAPLFTAGTVNPQAAGFSPFTLTFSRSDADQTLGGITVRTPPGLLGVLKSVQQCPEPQAFQGTCGPESLIGHTTVGAGPGSNPFYVGGNVYLTGPYNGAPFGLSIVVHALAGPFDLGSVIVRAAINVDRGTAQLVVTSDPLPTILQGIPLDLRTVNVTVDRPGFMFNPTNCSPLSVGGTITSTQGAAAAVSNHFQAVNCATLPFKPKFTVLTHAQTSKANGAYLHVKVASGAGQANIAKVKVALPVQLPSRLTTLQKACVEATFIANPAACPAGSVVGEAAAVTPILNSALRGPAYLVSHGGAAFPDLEIVLQGEGITLVLDGNTDIKHGITTSTFNTVPDAPISTFDLVLPTGPHSALGAVGSLCRRALNMPTTITGQNGAQSTQTTRIAVAGCKAHKARKARSTKRGKAKGSSRRK